MMDFFFFATLADIKPFLEELEQQLAVQYTEWGLFDSKDIPHYDNYLSIPQLGYATHGDWNHDRRMLIMPKANTIVLRDIPQRDGSVKFLVDQGFNANSSRLQLGGIFKENVLVAGSFSSEFDDDFSKAVRKIFSKIKRRFKKIGMAYVGKDAEEKMNSGWQLVSRYQHQVK